MPLPGSLQLKPTDQIGICRYSPVSVAGFPAPSLETGREAPAYPASRLPPLAVMRRWRFIGLAVVAILLLGIAARRYVHGFTLVVRAGDLHGPVRRAADLDTVLISERIVRARVENASIRARVYAPIVTDRIEQAAVWLAAESELAPTGRIGLMGISFSGGLAVVAAGRPSLRNHLLYVFSFGGHDDLRRVLKYFCTGIEHEALAYSRQEPGVTKAIQPPHDYGLAIVLLNIVDHLVPPEQVAPLREAVRRFLWASYLDRVDKPQAERACAALRELARTLREPAATLLGYVNNRDVTHLGPQLLPYIGFYVDAPALSPSRSPKPSVPVLAKAMSRCSTRRRSNRRDVPLRRPLSQVLHTSHAACRTPRESAGGAGGTPPFREPR